MTGLFKVYLNFSPDNGSGGLGKARDMFVGLKGGFGTVLAGRIATPYKTSTVGWDTFNATFLQARGNNGRSKLHNGYADEVIAYANKFGSAKFVGAIALDESVDASNSINGEHTITFSVNMPVADNLELALAYLDASAANDGTAIKAGLKWKSGDLTISGQYETLGADITDPNVAGDQTSLYLNGNMKMGGGASIQLGFGQLSDDGDGGTTISLGYKNKMSKSVMAYAGVIAINDGVLGQGNSTTQFGGGVRVGF